ncbi:MAG: glutamine-dependent NAD(+) synthetase [Trizodia sp. TS-e1964]|nr:MAG: glutamine-dependent NAD(+) synthetase [Trizodia sp. TS-e1964]
MVRLTTIATCQLNQWAMDFEGNAQRIIESIELAKAAGATLRVGPELEITGYGCLDHFLEIDLYTHSWEMIGMIIADDRCQDILLDLGAPVMHKQVRLNCRVLCLNRQILLIRPKLWLANDGNYREMRYFTPWPARQHEVFYLPEAISNIHGQFTCTIGDAVIATRDTSFAPETCEELFTPHGPHIDQSLDGVEIFTNSSGSHHSLRKLKTRLDLIIEATKKSGGVYCYANQSGMDGDRLLYDGCALVVINGEIKAQGKQFSLDDVQVCCATVNLEIVRSFRSSSSRGLQAVQSRCYKRIDVPYNLSKKGFLFHDDAKLSPTIEPRYHSPTEEIGLGAGAYLWDYLRRSKQSGFFIPLSGGIDSCATSVIIYAMCRMVLEAIKEGNNQVVADARRICGEPEESTWLPSSEKELCGRIFHTCFMGTSNSSKETRERAKSLAEAIGAYHTDLNIDTVVSALTTLFTTITRFTPRFRAHGGSTTENLALQNIQARLRMVTAYMFAQLLPTIRGRLGGGNLLVLGSANVDECLRGYLTKYDCSSADINPIGGISKTDLKAFIAHAGAAYGLPILSSFLSAVPTAELEPITPDYVQSDEVDMGMTYAELSEFGLLRKVARLGPLGMWEHLVGKWGAGGVAGLALTPRQVYDKVRWFYSCFNNNRHKMTVMTPALHMESYSPDDNRFDLRPFVYPVFTWPYKKIEIALAALEARRGPSKT